ncbi:CUB and zona pellucida-like domain-containing protein 1 [Branchiostoma lanceolatum]|uniref:CUB and zona pellucida-like domain-containing protein 1 n=1 Tax=Branchiostoma lanceolatum TaxID=7740 RepID=UPI003456C0DC
MTSTNVKAACEAAGYITPCNGNSGCRYASSSCVNTGSTQCGNPMNEVSRELCGASPISCAQFHGVYQFMNAYINGAACGAESRSWCVNGNGQRDRYAFCATDFNGTTSRWATAQQTTEPTTTPRALQDTCPSNYERVDADGASKCLRFSAVGDRRNYQAASQTCMAEGARLVVIKSTALNSFIDNRIQATYAAETWIGLDDLTAPSGEYRWSDGSVLGGGDFNDWHPGQPDTNYGEKCVEIRPQVSYNWNNHHCHYRKNYICEKALAPVSELAASTTCTNDYMELSIPEDQLTDINLNNLHWEPDQNCGATTNGTHFLFRTDLYGCGTQVCVLRALCTGFVNDKVSFGSKYVTFLNTINILGVHQSGGVITREGDISITSKCKYERQEWVDSTFLPIPGGLNFTEEGFGQLEVRLSMFPTRQYQSQYRANQYPIHLKLRQHVYMQLEVQGHGQNLSVLALNCKATMSPEPNDTLQYQLINDGCASDPTLKIYNINDNSKERFGLEAFRFIREVKTVYVHCEVIVCNAADSGSRCAQGCVSRGKRDAGEKVDMRGRHMIYQGPIVLDDDKEAANTLRLVNDEETATDRRSAPWAALAAGGGLVALALAVLGAAIVLKRSRREKWAYQGLPDMEEDGE